MEKTFVPGNRLLGTGAFAAMILTCGLVFSSQRAKISSEIAYWKKANFHYEKELQDKNREVLNKNVNEAECEAKLEEMKMKNKIERVIFE